MSAETRKLADYAESKIAKAITASNILITKLSHDKNVIGDEHITGRVGGNARRVQKGPSEKKQRATKSIGVPVSRKGRPTAQDGRTTFHMRNTVVHASSIDDGKLGSADHHDDYLNRENAVPSIPMQAAIGAAGQERYLERDGAPEALDGNAVVLSNISTDSKIRADFHEKMEANERVACGDTRLKAMKLNVRGNPEFFRKLILDAELPSDVRDAVDKSLLQSASHQTHALLSENPSDDELSEWVVVEPGDVRKLRQCLERAGWKKNNKKWSQTACFDQGSSAQVYHRIEGELPADLNPVQRVAALKSICRIFERENLPYIAVLHAPDEMNDPDNVHFHILYYSRPAEKMTQDREKHFAPHLQHVAEVMAKSPEREPPKIKRQMEIRTEAWPHGAPLPPAFEGLWDFEVSYKYKSGKRSFKLTHPFRQMKSRRVVSAAWPKELRAHVAKSINEELGKACKMPRLHPGTMKDLEIDKTPETKLFKDQSDRELRGIPTITGIQNERSDWKYRIGQLERKKVKDKQAVSAQRQKLSTKFHRIKGRTPASVAAFEADLDQYASQHERAIQVGFESEISSEYIARLRSRPAMMMKRHSAVARKADHDIAALGTASPKKLAAAKSRASNAKRAQDQAQEYILELNYELGEALALPDLKSEEAEIARKRAATALRKIRTMLTNEPELAVPSPPVPLVTKVEVSPPHQPKPEPVPIPTPSALVNSTSRKPKSPPPAALFARGLLDGRRRLRVNSVGHIVPITFEHESEKSLISDTAYLTHQIALQKIKKSQDKSVADVVECLLASPSTLQLREPDAQPVSRRYELKVNVPRYRQDFLLFWDDPQIIANVEHALERNTQKRLDEAQRERDEQAAKARAQLIAQRMWQEEEAAAKRNKLAAADDAGNQHKMSSPQVSDVASSSLNVAVGSVSSTAVPKTSAAQEISDHTTLHSDEKKHAIEPVTNKASPAHVGKEDDSPTSREATVAGPALAPDPEQIDAPQVKPIETNDDRPSPAQGKTTNETGTRSAEPSATPNDIRREGKAGPSSNKNPLHCNVRQTYKPSRTVELAVSSMLMDSNESRQDDMGSSPSMPLLDQAEARSGTEPKVPNEAVRGDPSRDADRIAADFVERSANDLFALEEGHKGMALPNQRTMLKYGLDEADLLHPTVQADLNRRLHKQWEDEGVMRPILRKHVREEDTETEDSIIDRIPQGEDRAVIERWRNTGLLHEMMRRIGDDQRRETKEKHKAWTEARDEGLPKRNYLAALIDVQQRRWPVELPANDRDDIKRQAALHQQFLTQSRGLQMD